MTLQEGKDILFNRIDTQIQKSGWWIFNKKDITLSITRILEPYEKVANFPLPAFVRLDEVRIDIRGIASYGDRIAWSEISASGITKETVHRGDQLFYRRNLLLCLHTGDIVTFPIADFDRFKGLLGHFIEQYKLAAAGGSVPSN